MQTGFQIINIYFLQVFLAWYHMGPFPCKPPRITWLKSLWAKWHSILICGMPLKIGSGTLKVWGSPFLKRQIRSSFPRACSELEPSTNKHCYRYMTIIIWALSDIFMLLMMAEIHSEIETVTPATISLVLMINNRMVTFIIGYASPVTLQLPVFAKLRRVFHPAWQASPSQSTAWDSNQYRKVPIKLQKGFSSKTRDAGNPFVSWNDMLSDSLVNDFSEPLILAARFSWIISSEKLTSPSLTCCNLLITR